MNVQKNLVPDGHGLTTLPVIVIVDDIARGLLAVALFTEPNAGVGAPGRLAGGLGTQAPHLQRCRHLKLRHRRQHGRRQNALLVRASQALMRGQPTHDAAPHRAVQAPAVVEHGDGAGFERVDEVTHGSGRRPVDGRKAHGEREAEQLSQPGYGPDA